MIGHDTAPWATTVVAPTCLGMPLADFLLGVHHWDDPIKATHVLLLWT